MKNLKWSLKREDKISIIIILRFLLVLIQMSTFVLLLLLKVVNIYEVVLINVFILILEILLIKLQRKVSEKNTEWK